jgi:hypothetical protein
VVLVLGEVVAEQLAQLVEELVHLGSLEAREQDLEELVVREFLQCHGERAQVGLAVHAIHHRARVLFDIAMGVFGHGASIAEAGSYCSMEGERGRGALAPVHNHCIFVRMGRMALFDEALKLPLERRAELAAALLRSLDGEPDQDVEAAWAAEIDKRAREIQAGEAVTEEWEVVRDRAYQRLRKP